MQISAMRECKIHAHNRHSQIRDGQQQQRDFVCERKRTFSSTPFSRSVPSILPTRRGAAEIDVREKREREKEENFKKKFPRPYREEDKTVFLIRRVVCMCVRMARILYRFLKRGYMYIYPAAKFFSEL